MRNTAIATVLTVGFALALPAATAAQAPLALSLDDAIRRGVEHAPRLAEGRAHEAAAASTVTARSALSSPTVTASSGYLRTNHVDAFGIPQAGGGTKILFPDIPNNYQARGEVDVPVYTAGRVKALVASAGEDRAAAAADLKAAEQDVRLQIAVAYWTLVTSRESVRVLDIALQRFDAWVGDVKSRVDAGVLPPNDLLSAQAQRAHQSVQLIQARNAAALAQADLARLVGVDPDQIITPVTPLDQPLAASVALASQTPAALASQVSAGRAERQALLARSAASTAAGTAAMAALRPTIGASAAVQPARPNQLFVPRADQWKTSWSAAVNVSWELFDGGKAHAERAAADAQAEAFRRRLEDFDAMVAVEVRQRLLDLDSDRAALAASAEGVTAATEALRVVGERFEAGVATSTDVLDAQVALREAELERTQLSVAARIAEARLLRTVGGL